MKKAFLLPSLLLISAAPRETPRPVPSPPAVIAIEGLPIDVLPRQAMPTAGCAAFLWTATDARNLIAMASVEPAQLRLSIGGSIVDLPRTAQGDGGNFGLADSTDYAAPGIHATLVLKTETRGDLVKGGVVTDGSLQLDRDGRDGVAVPIKGLVGCA